MSQADARMDGASTIESAIAALNTATLSPSVIRASGAGKAYQSVAQSSAIAVQDATDTLRNLSTIATTVIGVALAQLVATGDPKYAAAIEQAQLVMTNAAAYFQAVGQSAGAVLSGFPDGS